MPLDVPALLSSQGWNGKGHPLQANSNGLSKPIIIPQKKNLGGIGKDRDESFAFWDHVYAASAQSMQIKIHDDSDNTSSGTDVDDQTSSASSSHLAVRKVKPLPRTSTGLLSNRPPPVTTEPAEAPVPKLSALDSARKEMAKRGLYSRFLRGPTVEDKEKPVQVTPSLAEITSPSEESTSPLEVESALFPQSEPEPEPSTSTPDIAPLTIAVDELDLEAVHKAEKAAKKALREAKHVRRAEKRRVKAERRAASESASESPKPGKKRKRDEVVVTDTKGALVTPKRRRREQDLSELEPEEESPCQPPKSDSALPGPESPCKQAPSPCPRKVILKIRRRSRSRSVEPSSRRTGDGRRVTFAETVQQRVVTRWLKQVG